MGVGLEGSDAARDARTRAQRGRGRLQASPISSVGQARLYTRNKSIEITFSKSKTAYCKKDDIDTSLMLSDNYQQSI